MNGKTMVEHSRPLTQQELMAALHYDPETGVFTRTFKNGKSKQVGSINTKGYVCIPLGNVKYVAHRLAWLWVYGKFPDHQVDHINQNRQDNRIANLREATNKQNCENRSVQKNNTTGFAGVSWKARNKKWVAQICHNRQMIHLGLFQKIEDAIAARAAAQKTLFTHCREGA
jgi:hypothetical protein